jgi:hypothetical protein
LFSRPGPKQFRAEIAVTGFVVEIVPAEIRNECAVVWPRAERMTEAGSLVMMEIERICSVLSVVSEKYVDTEGLGGRSKLYGLEWPQG